jgi:hypothetical protein
MKKATLALCRVAFSQTEQEMSERSLFFFHRNRNIRICREPHFVALHSGNQSFVDEVVMALVRAFAAVFFGKFDAAAFYLVDGTHVNAVRADDFHVFFDIGHKIYPCEGVTTRLEVKRSRENERNGT